MDLHYNKVSWFLNTFISYPKNYFNGKSVKTTEVEVESLYSSLPEEIKNIIELFYVQSINQDLSLVYGIDHLRLKNRLSTYVFYTIQVRVETTEENQKGTDCIVMIKTTFQK